MHRRPLEFRDDRLSASADCVDPELRGRFDADLRALLPPGGRLGVAVSGGPDSLALLLLTAAARPGELEAATVDHRLRPESADEAEMVAQVCRRLQVPHAILPVSVPRGASLQAQARQVRYQALAAWAARRGLDAVLTAHHADDQAETLLMRLARGTGLAGLAGIRPSIRLAGGVPILRPLLGWRKQELVAVVAAAGLTSVDDPANSDPRHDRARARAFLGAQQWPDPAAVAASAAHLAEAEEALAFATSRLAEDRIAADGEVLTLAAADLPRELQRRLLLKAFGRLGATAPRGPDLARALTTLRAGGTCTLGRLMLRGGDRWQLSAAPRRR